MDRPSSDQGRIPHLVRRCVQRLAHLLGRRAAAVVGMTADKIVVTVSPRVRHRWAMRLGFWFLSLAAIDIEADGKKLGSKRIVDMLTLEETQ